MLKFIIINENRTNYIKHLAYKHSSLNYVVTKKINYEYGKSQFMHKCYNKCHEFC